MFKTLLSAALLVAFCATAQAAPSASRSAVTGATGGQNYWLSDGLNRLVFWKPPAKSRADRPTR